MKYYYTDPLAAAWMAKHFGMKFLAGSCELYVPEWRVLANGNEGIKYYIHPDSMHLLEPQVGDYVYLPAVFGFDVIDEVFSVTRNGNVSTVSYKRPYGKNVRVILRKNIPFHRPESE